MNMVVPYPFSSDAGQYVKTAINIAEQGVFGDNFNNNQITVNRLPGYPLVLSYIWTISKDVVLFYKLSKLANVILGSLSFLLLYQISRNQFSITVSIIIATIFSFQPHILSMEGYILTESLFTFEILLIAWMVSLFCRKNFTPIWLAIGLMTGYALLTRPSFLMFFIFCILVIVLSRQNINSYKRVTAYYILGLFLAILPWAAYTGAHDISFTGTKNNVNTMSAGFYPDLVYKDKRYYGFPYRDPEAPKGVKNDYNKAFEKLTEWVKEDPVKYTKWFLIGKPLVLWQWNIVQGQGDIFIYRVTGSAFYNDPFFVSIKNLYKSLHGTMFFMMLGGIIVVLIKRNSLLDLFIVSIILYFFIIHSIYFSLPRYSIPLRPFMIYLDAYFIITCIKYALNNIKFTDNDRLSSRQTDQI